MSIALSFLELSVHTLLEFLKDTPVFLVVAFFIVWIGCWLPLVAILAITLNWQIHKSLQPEQKIPLLVSLYLLVPLILWGFQWLKLGSFPDYGLVGEVSIFASLFLGFSLGVFSLAIVFLGQIRAGWCYLEKSQKLGTVNHTISYMKGSSQKIPDDTIKALKFKRIFPKLLPGDCLIHHPEIIHGSYYNKSNYYFIAQIFYNGFKIY
jgi:hypothetical protein